MPGIEPLTAAALTAAVDNGMAFPKGRDLAAWLGEEPISESLGQSTGLLRIAFVAGFIAVAAGLGAEPVFFALNHRAAYADHSSAHGARTADKVFIHTIGLPLCSKKLERIDRCCLAVEAFFRGDVEDWEERLQGNHRLRHLWIA